MTVYYNIMYIDLLMGYIYFLQKLYNIEHYNHLYQ